VAQAVADGWLTATAQAALVLPAELFDQEMA
jgi:hypothetical protein